MIYEKVDEITQASVSVLNQKIELIEREIELKQEAVKIEDSKSKEKQLIDDIKRLKRERSQLYGEISCIKEETFKKLLMTEYNVIGNPKFEKAYWIAYEHGHSSGYSDVEIYFSELAELIQ